jgi:hypothetical protein
MTMKKLFLIPMIALLIVSFSMSISLAASITLGWQQPDVATGNTNFYGWKVWYAPTQNGTYTQFGSDIVWNGTVQAEYLSGAMPISPPAGAETTYYFKLDAWNKPGTSTPLNSGFSNIVSATWDYKPPSLPVVTPALPATTVLASITVAGNKEANSSIWIGGSEKVAVNASTTWSVSMPLVLGLNTFSITSRDSEGNETAAVAVSTTRTAIAPPAAATNVRVIAKER